MFEKIINIFDKKENNDKCENLIVNFNPFTLCENSKFIRKEEYDLIDLKNELLDPKKSKDKIFTIYWNIYKKEDSLIFETSNLKCNIFILFPRLIGREYSKTLIFNTIYKEESKEALFEIMKGEGHFILESNFDEKKVIVVKVKEKDLVLVPKDYSFVIINSSENQELVCFSVIGKNTRFEKNKFNFYNGCSLYYTKQGFIKNENIDFLYKLENYEGNYIFDNSFNKKNSLYEEFVKFPEKFNFLK